MEKKLYNIARSRFGRALVSIGVGSKVEQLPRTFLQKLFRRPVLSRSTIIFSIHVQPGAASNVEGVRADIDLLCMRENLRIEWVVLEAFDPKARRR
ncbi:MAG: hypothetical protein IT381_28205 [Deltaproteobacteria bacterium]|nr:hypothetical protein [Deltaproteobacteria bacterium]